MTHQAIIYDQLKQLASGLPPVKSEGARSIILLAVHEASIAIAQAYLADASSTLAESIARQLRSMGIQAAAYTSAALPIHTLLHVHAEYDRFRSAAIQIAYPILRTTPINTRTSRVVLRGAETVEITLFHNPIAECAE
jgi:hypothetical protein